MSTNDERTTDEQIAEWQNLLRGVSDGPWVRWTDLDGIDGFVHIGDQAGALTVDKPITEDCNPVAKVFTVEDAEFICSAREIVSKLIAVVVFERDRADRWEKVFRDAPAAANLAVTQAWDEGYAAGQDNLRTGSDALYGEDIRTNPYRGVNHA